MILLAMGVANIALLWQYILKGTIFISRGYFRHIEPISSFPYTCRRLTDPALHSCEDMWLNSATRTLYLACSDVPSRKYWSPNIGRLTVENRSLTDHIVALDLESGPNYSFTTIKTSGYSDISGSSSISLVGLTGHHVHSTGLTYLYLVNANPSYNTTGHLIQNIFTGANSTIEVFATSAISDSLQHIRTFTDAHILTPNNVAFHPQSGGIYFTNDHGAFKAGLGHYLSPILGTGDLSYCSPSDPPICSKVASGFKFPNGLHLSPTDGFIYVPSASDGSITVFKPVIKYPAAPNHEHDSHGHSHSPESAPYYDGTVEEVTKIKTEYPIDNLSEDQDGDIWAAAFPNTLILKKVDDPSINAPSTALRIKRGEWVLEETKGKEGEGKTKGRYEYIVEKVIEDRDGEVLPASTTVIRDAVSGRLWLSGVVSEFVTVCEPK